ncbi:MAG TPA: type II secretion system protein [Deltaproteobacteria bacterium]|nr:type II secretion system protein [Deltaproteobacteria bacterium]
MKKKGFTLIELLVVIAIIAMLLAILMPALNKVKKIAQRVVCGTNLKGFGNAQTVYANDFDGQYVCQGQNRTLTWGNWTPGLFGANKVFVDGEEITVGASLYLLVRLADVSPKSFVCPASDQKEFSGRNPNNLDIVELWDFGRYDGNPSAGWESEGPRNCVSYAYHQPYMGGTSGQAGRNRADDTRSAAFAVMADKNPWYDPKIPNFEDLLTAYSSDKVTRIGAYWDSGWNPPAGTTERQNILAANAFTHEREGQNVMFADGHASFEKTSDVGIKNDNIYTPYVISGSTNAYHWRRGNMPGNGRPTRSLNNNEAPLAPDDSFLVNDIVTITPHNDVRP